MSAESSGILDLTGNGQYYRCASRTNPGLLRVNLLLTMLL
jgi:hypothetical protein